MSMELISILVVILFSIGLPQLRWYRKRVALKCEFDSIDDPHYKEELRYGCYRSALYYSLLPTPIAIVIITLSLTVVTNSYTQFWETHFVTIPFITLLIVEIISLLHLWKSGGRGSVIGLSLLYLSPPILAFIAFIIFIDMGGGAIFDYS